MLSKTLECLDCGFKGRAPRESNLCPKCFSTSVLTMTNRQQRIARKRRLAEQQLSDLDYDEVTPQLHAKPVR